MNISVKTLIIVLVGTLAGGLILGWLFFAGSSESGHSHNEIVNGETIWTCSMHPQIRQNEPGQCPICGMDLIPVDQEMGSIDPMAVSMSPTAIQLANVSTALVGSEPATKTIRLNGKVQEDERLIYSQTTHFPGRIERLTVNFTGEYVSRGNTIAYLYSPQLVTSQEELIEAYKIRERQPELYQAARQKLSNWKLSEKQIDQIISSGMVKEEFPVLADQSGYVVSKLVNLGDYVNRGQTLYEITNLSRVWVMFDIYENDLPWINRGDQIEFTVKSAPGKIFTGVIDYIDPVIDPKTRVAKARLVIKNEDLKLKPEMFVSGSVRARVAHSSVDMTVPKSAVMWTGERSVVYVKQQTDQGVYFKMREVTLGPALGDAYIVKHGLHPGEEIAVNGTFSIDAAAQLAGKPSMMSPPAGGGAAMTGHNHAGMPAMQENQPESGADHSQQRGAIESKLNPSDQTFDSDPSFRQQLQSVFKAYLPVKDALVKGDPKVASNEAQKLLTAIEKVDMTLVSGNAHMEWMKDVDVLKSATKEITEASDLRNERILLSPLSDQLFYSLRKFQVEVDAYRQYCPMAFNNEGAFWLSDSQEILNPYFGESMLTCGHVDEKL